MNFHEDRFPPRLSLGSSGGPERKTEVVTLANGFEERNTPWENSRRRYDAGVAMKSLDDLQAVIAFFEARRGRLFGFRWKDWSDFKSCAPSQTVSGLDQEIGVGDGAKSVFQLSKTYTSGGADYQRRILKPVEPSVKIAVNGVDLFAGQDFGVDASTGVVSIYNAPENDAVVSAGFEFDVPVRFDSDFLDVTVASFSAGEIPSVPVVEVRV